jgi:hypothetical protein
VGDGLLQRAFRQSLAWAAARLGGDQAIRAFGGGQPAGPQRGRHGGDLRVGPGEQRAEFVRRPVRGGPAPDLCLLATAQDRGDLVHPAGRRDVRVGQIQMAAFVRCGGAILVDRDRRAGAVGRHGAKSMSESPFNPVAPAFANALRDATGIRFTELPLTRDRVWLALHEAGVTDQPRSRGSS